jgi:hypothetical protein
MAKADTYSWEDGGTYLEGECDIPTCKNRPNLRRFYYPTYMNGDAELEASLCNEHIEYKQFNTTQKIIEAFNRKNQIT